MHTYIQDPPSPAKACVIWMHGIGADAQDMKGLASQLPVQVPIRHVFIDAPVRPITLNNNLPMRAWYDVLGFGMSLQAREDKQGILQSEKMIVDVLKDQLTAGFDTKPIFLAGFSQGGAMALFTGLRSSIPLAGIIALSTYLPLKSECQSTQASNTPIFLATGKNDLIVPPALTRQIADWIKSQGNSALSLHEYTMEHAVSWQEIQDIAHWLTERISAAAIVANRS